MTWTMTDNFEESSLGIGVSNIYFRETLVSDLRKDFLDTLWCLHW